MREHAHTFRRACATLITIVEDAARPPAQRHARLPIAGGLLPLALTLLAPFSTTSSPSSSPPPTMSPVQADVTSIALAPAAASTTAPAVTSDSTPAPPTPEPTSTSAPTRTPGATPTRTPTPPALPETCLRQQFADDMETCQAAPSYDIDLTVDVDSARVTGRQVITYTNAEQEALNELVLQLLPNAPGYGGTMTVTHLLLSGQ